MDNWFKDGVQFECTGCGKCCEATLEESGQSPVTTFTREEARRIAKYLGLTVSAFMEHHTEIENGILTLNWVISESPTCYMHCTFYNPITHQCGIHEVKPHQCRTFPYWPSMLASRESWNEQKALCEGINQGPLITESELLAKLKDRRVKKYNPLQIKETHEQTEIKSEHQ